VAVIVTTPAEDGAVKVTALPDVLVMLYAIAGGIAAWTEAVKGATWDTAFSTVAALPTKRLGDTGDGFSREPFGFVDGISQPELDWQQERRTGVTELTYGNSVALGEFLLGYRNEYGNFTDRPLLDPVTDPHNLLSRAADNPTKCDLGRNGTYLVLRDLQQNVRRFWQYLERQANVTGATRQLLAEAMVGRTMAGDPLVAQAERHIAGVSAPMGYGGDEVASDLACGARLRACVLEWGFCGVPAAPVLPARLPAQQQPDPSRKDRWAPGRHGVP